MIRIYPSKLDGEPIERHATDAPQTLEAWLLAKVPSYQRRAAPPISIDVNGQHVPADEWATREFGPRDLVCIFPEPKGAELIIAAVTLAAAATLVSSLLIPKPPKVNDQGGPGQGEDIGLAAAKGNKIKVNSPIRELAGRHKIYPDYLLPTRRYFVDMREQWVDLMLCVGVGEYDMPEGQILIGDTAVPALGDDVVMNIYQPGASVAADPAAEWWHSAPEVGATSTGTAGLDLRAVTPYTPNAEFQSASYSGVTVTIPVGAGSFPANWVAGIVVRIDARYPYTISDGTGTGGRDVINGDIDQLGLPDGALIEIAGDNAGDYIVFSQTAGTMQLNYADGSPAVGLSSGSASMAISYRGLHYEILTVSSSTLAVDRLTDTGSVDGGWPGFGALSTTTSTISVDAAASDENWTGPFPACPDGEVTNTIEFDVFFPQGLYQLNKYNNPVAFPVTVELQYRDITVGGAWTAVSRTYNGGTIDQIGFTELVALGSSFRPECRMRRITPDSLATTVSDAVQWYGLRSRLIAPTSYAGATTMTLRIRGGNRLASQSEQLVSTQATRVLPVRSGGAEAGDAPTRSIAPWVRYVAKSVGYTDADLDLAELDRLGDIWDARGDFYDFPHDGNTTVKAVLSDALGAGFADTTIDRGRIRPARDELRAPDAFEHMYTPQNMAEPLTRNFKSPSPDDFDGVDVEYVDPTTWNVETVQCRLPGDIGARVEKIRANGVANRDRAWRIGMRQRRSHKYRRWTYNWGTELDALNSRYLSYVATADNTPGYAQTAIMVAVAGSTVTSSEPLVWGPALSHVAAFRRPDGSLSGPYAATRVDDFRFTIAPALDFTPDVSGDIEPPHILFGTSTLWSFPTLVTEISPNGAESVSVTGVNYDARIYADDDGTAPA